MITNQQSRDAAILLLRTAAVGQALVLSDLLKVLRNTTEQSTINIPVTDIGDAELYCQSILTGLHNFKKTLIAASI